MKIKKLVYLFKDYLESKGMRVLVDLRQNIHPLATLNRDLEGGVHITTPTSYSFRFRTNTSFSRRSFSIEKDIMEVGQKGPTLISTREPIPPSGAQPPRGLDNLFFPEQITLWRGLSVNTLFALQCSNFLLVFLCGLDFIYTNQTKGEYCSVKSPPSLGPAKDQQNSFNTPSERTFCLKYLQPTKMCRTKDYLEICANKVVKGFSTMEESEKKRYLIYTYQDFRYHNNRIKRALDVAVMTLAFISITPFLRVLMRIVTALVTRSTAVVPPSFVSVAVTVFVSSAVTRQIVVIIKWVTGTMIQITFFIISSVRSIGESRKEIQIN